VNILTTWAMKAIRIAFPVVLFLGSLIASPAPQAQQVGKVARIGFLQAVQNENVTAFVQALRDVGYVDGQNVLIEIRIYGARLEQLPTLANELVTLKCDVILAAAPYAIRAATSATSTIPIVGIDLESDPVESGWARSLSHPGGNLTGVFLDLPELAGKQLQLLTEAVPGLSRVGVVWDSTIGDVQFRATEAAARAAGVTLQSLAIQRVEEVKDAFDRAAREGLHGVVILSSPLINAQRSHITSLAVQMRLPTISLFTLFPRSGGLMAYGPNLPDMYKRAVTYIDKILKGTKVTELPIERPSRFEFVVNVKTAEALGLTIPPIVLFQADEVIK
jgi:putative tryptophan/tyrosine transport system substrate-binding protein